MKLTTRGRFAVSAMVDLAIHQQEAPIRIAVIAQRQSLSLAYLEQIFCKLRRAGLVKSVRGPGGGYELGREPAHISIADIVDVMDENMDATQCQGGKACKGGVECLTHHLWEDLNGVMTAFLKGVTLADMVERHRRHPHQQHVSVSDIGHRHKAH